MADLVLDKELSAVSSASEAEGSFLDIGGERFYRIANHDVMRPFFMSLVSDSDHWFFISSNGALTAGRRDADHALFPYDTDDRIHDSLDQTGSKTLLQITRGPATALWEPFSMRYEGIYSITRNLYKSVYGNKIIFEEINHDLELSFQTHWMNSDRFGLVRRSVLANQGTGPVKVDLLDGIQNVLPCGLGRRFQMEYSTLGDAYKRTELLPKAGLALFRLSSIPADQPEPNEALRVNVAWSTGLHYTQCLLSSAQVRAFRQGKAIQGETDVRGQRGAYLLNATLLLAEGAQREWHLVADLGLDAVRVQALKHLLENESNLTALVLEDVERGTRNLVNIVASADGLQLTGDEPSAWRHFSNTLFNVMRGGLPDDGYRISLADLRSFLRKANRDLANRHASFLDSLPETLPHAELLSRTAVLRDVDLDRLVTEYLPLTFSRRHGDPSRPWNVFSIQVKDAQGKKILGYEGNWRDIFQNWEALGFSFPGYLESMIFKFADSSTADGYNPYRVMQGGFDWEVIDPHDAWSFIGYWGDHQVIYFLKLLEASHRYHPGQLARLLTHRVFTYANVPYRIKPYADLLASPRDTITFDHEAHRMIMRRAEALGADGKALMGEGGIFHASLLEKLLVVILSKLSNFVPEAGIWMNTQRPEWNDANNALVGYGVSMVTLCYLRRFLAFCEALLNSGEATGYEISQEIAEWLSVIARVLEQNSPELGRSVSDMERKVVLDALGTAGSDYRGKIYQAGFSGERVTVSPSRLQAFIEVALKHTDHAIRVNRRPDGLYHAYNLMKVVGEGVEVRHLYEMLEGQVAVLSSGVLSPEAGVALLDALRDSKLYREDQASYILYPDRVLPHFLEMNHIPAMAVAESRLLSALLAAGDGAIVDRDINGDVHFNADFRNVANLKQALESLKQGELFALIEAEETKLLDLYEQVFNHQSFTGRSGSFAKYEGLGCIYWHMVSKLLLAVKEIQQQAVTKGADPATLVRLQGHYREIREGLGVHKSPSDYGAIPTDPYSHTPSFAGVQQPGMTGQVKEDFLTRFGEMGVQVDRGRLSFVPELTSRGEFLQHSATFHYVDVVGRDQSIALAIGSLAFTLGQVPVVLHLAGPPHLVVSHEGGTSRTSKGLVLDAETSATLFERAGVVTRIDVFLGIET